MSLEALTWQKDWMATFSGHAVFPLDLKQEDIRLEDIAHSLAQQARYNGHCKFIYSVGQHCLLISEALKRDGHGIMIQKIGLMHDASECYTGDITRPMKNSLNHEFQRRAKYDGKILKDIEHDVQKRIALRFALPFPWGNTVETYDTRITQDEKAQLFVKQDTVWTMPLPPLDVHIDELDWREVRARFLDRAWELGLK